MEKKTVVLALGHRALGNTLPDQQRATKEAAKAIADIVETGANIVISHSNSQQVGMIHMAMNEFAQNHEGYTTCPMSAPAPMRMPTSTDGISKRVAPNELMKRSARS